MIVGEEARAQHQRVRKLLVDLLLPDLDARQSPLSRAFRHDASQDFAAAWRKRLGRGMKPREPSRPTTRLGGRRVVSNSLSVSIMNEPARPSVLLPHGIGSEVSGNTEEIARNILDTPCLDRGHGLRPCFLDDIGRLDRRTHFRRSTLASRPARSCANSERASTVIARTPAA
jgi:hypothetical protein